MPTIRAVLFDFGKVLSRDAHPAAWQRMQQVAACTADELSQSYWRHRDDYDAGLLTGDSFWQAVAGRQLERETLDALQAADVDLWTDMNIAMLDWMHALHAAGVRTGILSNMPDAMAAGLERRFDWLQRFDCVIWSHALGTRKPFKAIYEKAVDGLNVRPAEILFIDDKAENITAAEAVGMVAVQYRDHDGFVREMNSRGLAYLLHPSKAALPVL